MGRKYDKEGNGNNKDGKDGNEKQGENMIREGYGRIIKIKKKEVMKNREKI